MAEKSTLNSLTRFLRALGKIDPNMAVNIKQRTSNSASSKAWRSPRKP